MNFTGSGKPVRVYHPRILSGLFTLLTTKFERDKIMNRKIKVLKELVDCMHQDRKYFGHQLPRGYTTTGHLFTWEVGGSGTSARIDELRKDGIDVKCHSFTHIDKKTKLLCDPQAMGFSKDEIDRILSSRFERLVDPNEGTPIECYAYCLMTPINRIDVENGKLIPAKLEQSELEF